MALRKLKPYTVLITATGKAPITLVLRPLPLLVGLATLVGVPTLSLAALTYHNWHLAQRNQTLTDTATEVLTELEVIGSEIEVLKHRAGVMEESEELDTAAPRQRSQGGPSPVASPETMFAAAQEQLPSLGAVLSTDVKPALEAVLESEAEQRAAFPDGKPLAGSIDVSSEFGLRSNPFGGSSYEVHEGIDFSGPVGTPVLATAAGVVLKADYERGYGNHVTIDHGYNYETLYAHLLRMEVKIGDRVERGDVVGYLGNTGRSSGPHLHYGIYRQGQAVNPRYFLKLGTPPKVGVAAERVD